ncbi:MAG: glycerophosphodiester phosphodiesterase [Acutalibacteraceae bacterium]|nr:glycerophosphodiester phosphodiesterase [Acutalibacteraceae bacterium]
MKTEILSNGFTYTAHTGCIKTADNSLEAIEEGAKYGADIVEFDLNFLTDGTPVLSHDKPKGKEVTLDEAFKKVSEYKSLKVNVDVKNVKNLKSVYPLAQKYGLEDRIFYTGVTDEFLEAVKNDSPEIPYYLNVSVDKSRKQTPEYLESLVKKVKDSGAVGINFNKDHATKKLVDTFHENDLLVSIWTVNKKRKMYKILSLKPDNITTRRPDKLKEILN